MDHRAYERMMTSSPFAQAIIDGRGHVIESNTALCDLLGVTRTSLLNRSLDEWFHPSYRGFFHGDLSDRVHWDAFWQGDLALVGRKGEKMWVEMTLYSLDSKRYGLVFRSIAERLKREDRYLDAIDSLERDLEAMERDHKRGYSENRMALCAGFSKGLSSAMANPLAYLRVNLERFDEYMGKLMTLQQAYELLIKDLDLQDQPHLLPRLNVVKGLRARYDVEFLKEDSKKLLANSIEGVEHLTELQKALKSSQEDYDPAGKGTAIAGAIDDALLLLSGRYLSDYKVEKSGCEDLITESYYTEHLVLLFIDLFAILVEALEERLLPEPSVLRVSGDEDELWLKLFIEAREVVIDLQASDVLFPSKAPPGAPKKSSLVFARHLIQKGGGHLTVTSDESRGTHLHLALPKKKSSPVK